MAYPPLVPITGPYGTYQIPGQVAGAFGVPEPVGPPPTFQPGELEGAILGDVPSVAGTEPLVPSGLPTAAPPPMPLAAPPPPPQAAPDLAPSVTRGPLPAQAPQPFVTPDEQAALDANRGPGPQPQPPAPAAPPPAPGTLASMYANLEQRKDIAQRQAALKAETADKEAAAYDAANAEEARLTRLRDAEREQVNKELGAARAKQASAMDAFVNHKVDEGRLWKNMSTSRKIFAGIGVALSGLGNALAKKGGAPNPALDIIMGAIKDDVRMQLADRDRLGQIVGMRKDAVNDLRQQYADGEAAYNGVVAGLTRRTANQVAAIAARAKSPEAKLAGENFAAELNGEADKIASDAQERDAAARQRELQNRLAKSSNALGWANYNRGVVESDRQFEEGKRRFDLELDAQNKAALAAADAKGGEAAAKQYREDLKDVEQRGINDPSTGEILLQPEGKKMVERAEQLEAAAAKQPVAAVADSLRNEAKALRAEARIKHSLKGRTPEKAGDLSQAYAAAQTAHGLLSDIKDFRKNAGWESDITKTPEYQAMRSRYAASKAITGKALQLGSMDEGTNNMLDELFGGDPTAWKGTEASIDAAIAMLEQRTGNMLRAEGLRGAEGFRFPRSTTPEKTAADRAVQAIEDSETTSEKAKSMGPTGAIRSLYYPFGGSESTGRVERDAVAAANLADPEFAGLSPEAGDNLRKLAAMATGTDKDVPADEKAKESARARKLLPALATSGPTERRLAAIEVMRSIGMNAEADSAVERLPTGEGGRRGVREFVQARAAAPANDNVQSLEAAARSGDGAARFRLVQMAGIPGPGQKEAGAALIRLTRGTR